MRYVVKIKGILKSFLPDVGEKLRYLWNSLKSENDILSHFGPAVDLFEYHLALSDGNYHIEISCEKFKKQKQLTFFFSISTCKPSLKCSSNWKRKKNATGLEPSFLTFHFPGKKIGSWVL